MPQHKVLAEILSLDPQRDHQRIGYLSCVYEFPWDTTRALEFALYRTYAVPSIAELLDKTGEFRQRARKRYDDTDLLISEIFEHGYDSERGRAAIRRMNQMHGRYAISNDDMLYVLSTFVYEAPRWIDQYSWRKYTEQERLSLFYSWREIGRLMNIRDIPASYEAFERFNIDYERKNFRFTEANRRIADATADLFVEMFVPFMPKPLARPFIYAMLDEALIEAFGYPKPSWFLRWMTQSLLKLRGRIVAMLPERDKPVLRTAIRRPSYPNGYSTPDQLGVKEQGG